MNNRIKVSDAETTILQILWKTKQPQSVAEVLEQAKEEGISWAYTTVATFLKRMENKKLVSIEKKDRTYYYSPLVKPENVNNRAKKYVSHYFKGSLTRFLAAFTENEQLSKEEIEELKAWVNKLDDK